ncbi:hypothetical protein [Sporanaerobacter acetigenes]
MKLLIGDYKDKLMECKIINFISKKENEYDTCERCKCITIVRKGKPIEEC